jgi:hypothetical protein
MPMPLTLEMIAPRATADGGSASAQVPALRLPAAAWSALLSALALDPRETALPGAATVVASAPGETYHIEYAGRVASFTWSQPLAVGTALRLVRAAAPALPAAAAPPVPADSALVGATIPALARLLDGALRDPPAPLALRLAASLPEAAGIPAAPQRLATALADAISGSGVFFESHLADWVRGERDTAPLLAEAQARASMLASAAEATGEAAFRQQLSSLVTGELAFQFPAWTGQNAALTIGREPEHAPHSTPPERVFLARLEMELPELGSVQAMLNLNSRGIDIELRAATPAAADALGAARDSLVQAFAAADLRVGRIEVSHERSR